MRLLLLFLLFAALSIGETFRLYLKDGDYQLVREYQVQGDRVRYYTTERGDYEEIPLSLVDLNRTEKERKAKQDLAKEDAKQDQEEAEAQRALRREIASVPEDNGAYYNVNGKVTQLEAATYQIVTNKKRATLKLLSPVPLVPGKASVIINGEHATFVVHDDRPTFYFRPEREERFGIVRVTPKKEHRVVENISVVPVTNVALANRDEIPVFQQEIADNLYKVWPEKSITPGEYAIIEYNDDPDRPDEMELLVWDFAYQPK